MDDRPISSIELLTRLESRVGRIETTMERLLAEYPSRQEIVSLESRITSEIDQRLSVLNETLRSSFYGPFTESVRVIASRMETTEKRLNANEDSVVLLRTAVAQLARIVERQQKILTGNGNPSLPEAVRASARTSEQALRMVTASVEVIRTIRDTMAALSLKMENLIEEQNKKTERSKKLAQALSVLLDKSPIFIGGIGTIITVFSSLWMRLVSQVPILQVGLTGGFILSISILLTIGLLLVRKQL